jgi:hypothetical protein
VLGGKFVLQLVMLTFQLEHLYAGKRKEFKLLACLCVKEKQPTVISPERNTSVGTVIGRSSAINVAVHDDPGKLSGLIKSRLVLQIVRIAFSDGFCVVPEAHKQLHRPEKGKDFESSDFNQMSCIQYWLKMVFCKTKLEVPVYG